MEIGILETGAPAPHLRERHGDYADMFERLLADAGFAFRRFDVQTTPPPADSACDGWLITGSAAGVYEPHAWIAPLEDFIRQASASRPVAGICFGHQIMARALGGAVEKSARGWGVGVHRYQTLDHTDWLEAPAQFDCAVSHQDQVIAPPAGARVIAGSNFCPYGVLEYAGGRAVSMQCHPEFEHAFALDLLEHRRTSIAADVSAVARETLKHETDRHALGASIARFFCSRLS